MIYHTAGSVRTGDLFSSIYLHNPYAKTRIHVTRVRGEDISRLGSNNRDIMVGGARSCRLSDAGTDGIYGIEVNHVDGEKNEVITWKSEDPEGWVFGHPHLVRYWSSQYLLGRVQLQDKKCIPELSLVTRGPHF